MAGTNAEPAVDLVLEEQVARKVFKRLIPFLFLVACACYLDRTNIGFAALSMNKDLRLTATVFGFANSLFFVGMMCCEIPSNLMLARFGARKWIARIMISWGLVSAAGMFVRGAQSLYLARFLLGVAEAGFTPGIMLLFTYWFPHSYRARATALCLFAQPITIAYGSPISGVILDHAHGFLGLSGWQWLFALEGLPAFVLGVMALLFLNDGPAQAPWLTGQEKGALLRRLQREQVPPTEKKVLREVFSWNLLLLAIMYFGDMTAMGTVTIWIPQLVNEVFKGYSLSTIGLFCAIPACFGALCSLAWGAHSDRRMERHYHFMWCMLAATAGWLLVILFKAPQIRMLGLIFASVGVYSGQVIFWALAPQVISLKARPLGIGFIATFAPIASIVQFAVMGLLRDRTHSWVAGLLYVTAMLFLAAVLVVVVAVRTKREVVGANAGAA